MDILDLGNILLPLDLLDLVLQVVLVVVLAPGARDEPRRVGEERVHFLEWNLLGLGLEGPEEDCVCQIADDEEDVEFVADVCEGDLG